MVCSGTQMQTYSTRIQVLTTLCHIAHACMATSKRWLLFFVYKPDGKSSGNNCSCKFGQDNINPGRDMTDGTCRKSSSHTHALPHTCKHHLHSQWMHDRPSAYMYAQMVLQYQAVHSRCCNTILLASRHCSQTIYSWTPFIMLYTLGNEVAAWMLRNTLQRNC